MPPLLEQHSATAAERPRFPAWIEALALALHEPDGDMDAAIQQALRRVAQFAPATTCAAAVLMAIVETADSSGMLFIRRRDGIATHPGQVAFPGGAREGAETAEQTALREAEEETALPAQRVRVLGRLPKYPTTSGYRVSPVVGYVSDLPPLRAQPEEVADIFVVPLEVLLDAGHWQERALRVHGKFFLHRELHYCDQRIWGATAGMLRLLLPALRKARGEAA